MADASQNDRLAERLLSIGATLRNGSKPPSAALGEDDLAGLAQGLRGWLDPILADIKKSIAELEATAVKYSGVWDPEKAYSAGTLVTFQGGMWHCEDANCGARPGSGSSAWTLANKSRR